MAPSDEYPEGFDPDDLDEMSYRLERIYSDLGDMLIIQFEIDKESAKVLVRQWTRAALGDPLAISICMSEMGKIVKELKRNLRASGE